MTSSDYIVEVSEADFQSEVLAYSNQAPVVVDFWAEWCSPCHMLGPILEKLANEAQGAFRLAKVNVDENPNLAIQYGVRGIPAVKAFRGGQVIAEFTGAQPEPKVREFLRKLAPSQGDLSLEKGNSLLDRGEWKEAASSFRRTLQENPDHSRAMLGLAKSLIAQGQSSDALMILQDFPASAEFAAAERLLPLAEAIARLRLGEEPLDEDDPLAPAYRHALKLVALGNLPAALDGMLDILRQDKGYRDGGAHQVTLGMLELLGEENLQTRAYRSELASILF